MPFVCTFRIARRASLFGVGTSRIRSNRPVRSMAGSSRSGRFVAPITVTPSRVSSPSIDVKSWFTTRSLTPLSVSNPRTWATASNSSRKTMQGATCFAFLKIMRTAFSDSPTHFDMTSGPLMEMKFASDSVATAFARSVLPEPGGPYRRIPRGGRMPIRLKASGSFNRHATRVNLEDFLAPHTVGDADLDLPVETSGSSKGRIDRLVAVRCADHDDLAATRETVHESEELRDHASLDLARHLFPFRRNRIEFVDEQDAGRVLLRLLELLAKAFFTLSVILRHDFRALDRIEVRARFVRDGLCDQRLAGSGRAVQEHALRRVDAEAFEQLRVLEGELDHLADLHQLLLEPTDVFVGDGGCQDLALADGFLLHLDDRVILDLDDPLRARADHR